MKRVISALLMMPVCVAVDWSWQSFLRQSRASAAYYSGHAANAQHEFERLLVDHPEQVVYLRGCADSLYAQEQYEQAARYYQLAGNLTSDKTVQEDLLFNSGCCQAQQKQFKTALETFEKVIALNANNQRARHNIDILKQLLKEQKQQKNNKQDKSDGKGQSKNDQKDGSDSQSAEHEKQSAQGSKSTKNGDKQRDGDEHDKQRNDNQRSDADQQQPKSKSNNVPGQHDKQVQNNGGQQEPQPEHDNTPSQQATRCAQNQPIQNSTPKQTRQLDKQADAVLAHVAKLEQEGQRLYVRAVSGQHQQQKRGEHDW